MLKVLRDGRTFLTVGQVAERFQVARWVVRILCEREVLKCIRNERGWRLFPESDLEATDLVEVRRAIDEVQKEFGSVSEHGRTRDSRGSDSRCVPYFGPSFHVDPSDLFVCNRCGMGNLVWALSRRGTYYAVHAKWNGKYWIANRRDFHSFDCTGDATLRAERAEFEALIAPAREASRIALEAEREKQEAERAERALAKLRAECVIDPREFVTCKYCGAQNLAWGKAGSKTGLHSLVETVVLEDGRRVVNRYHDCPEFQEAMRKEWFAMTERQRTHKLILTRLDEEERLRRIEEQLKAIPPQTDDETPGLH